MTSLLTHDQAEALIADARGHAPVGSSAVADDELRALAQALATLRATMVDATPPAPSGEIGTWLAGGRRPSSPRPRPVAWWRRAGRAFVGLGLGVQIAIGVGAGVAVAGIGIAHHQGVLADPTDRDQGPHRPQEPVGSRPADPRHRPSTHPHSGSPAPTTAGTASPHTVAPSADQTDSPAAASPEQDGTADPDHAAPHGTDHADDQGQDSTDDHGEQADPEDQGDQADQGDDQTDQDVLDPPVDGPTDRPRGSS